MPSEPAQRSATALDYLASAAARVAPRAFGRAIDQLRLDADTVLRGLAGMPSRSFRDATHPLITPPALADLDPIAAMLPLALRTRYETFRRDTAMIRNGLAGRGASPLVERRNNPRSELRTAPAADRTTLLAPRSLDVLEVVRETDDAVSLVLADPDGDPIRFVAGQFFTVLVDIDGTTHRRAYSASSDVRDPTRVRITIKRMREGRVSGHLHARIRVGDTVRVLGPSGNFTVTPDPARVRHYVLVGGGSGITPLFAIAQSVLALEPKSRVSLVYGNRSESDVIFRESLGRLASEHPERFVVRHVLESPPSQWAGGHGRLDDAGFLAQLEALAIDTTDAAFFVCGPEPMMNAVRETLVARGVHSERIHEERFTNPAARAESQVGASARAQRITFHVGGVERAVIAAPGQTVLEAGLAAGLSMPFSCAMGGCAACRVKVRDGDVEMEEPNCLSDAERADGYVLACVGRPNAPCTIEVPT